MARDARRRPLAGGIVVGMLLLPSAVNIATGALPDTWARFAWVGVPVAVVLTAVLVVLERRARAEAAPEEPRGGNQYYVTGPQSTQINSPQGTVNVQYGTQQQPERREP
ncbi:hypothetical protein AB0A63_11220 [Lentzea sp. NPDC042327]|uniref:hypothetical protein n=1 Tax=Lentzea sp. NPDC042327 TaxID=3154801 RepID=UPI00340550EA